MHITFENPGMEYMIEAVMAFQTEGESDFWSEPLYYFYPQLDRGYAEGLAFPQKRAYLEETLRGVYGEIEGELNEKVRRYQRYWDGCRTQITEALSDAFGVDCGTRFNDLRCRVSMNPVEPRFLRERCFDIFWRNSERGAIGEAIHEIIHFVWFDVWNREFADGYDEYERPSLKWILSEMVVEPIMSDPRLASLNPYFPREQGGCIYPYFFDMMVGGVPVMETLTQMYRTRPIRDFMRESYAYCLDHEDEIREHIRRSEG